MLEIQVKEQAMYNLNNPAIANNSVNFLQIKVEFDESWDGLNKSYQFKNGDDVYQVESNEEIITVPHEVLENAGTLEIMIKGTILAQDNTTITKRATVTPLSYIIFPSNLSDNPANAGEATPTVVEQIRDIAQSVRDDADEGEFTPEFSIGNVESIEGQPEVNMTGTQLEPVLNFRLPKGEKGDVNFFTFDVVSDGSLIMYKTVQYTGNIDFEIDNEGNLIEKMEVA